MSKKIFAIVVSFAMILTLLSASLSVFAEDKQPENPKLETVIEQIVSDDEPVEKAEEVTAEPVDQEEEKVEEPAEETEKPVVTEPEEEPEEVEEEVSEEPKEEVETPEEEPKNPEEGEDPAPEEQPGEETETPEEPAVDVPEAPVNPEEVELDPEAPVTNPEVNDVIGGGSSGTEGLPLQPEAPQPPVCSCGVSEGQPHEEGCPLYVAPEAPAEPQQPEAPALECTCGAEEGEAHAEDCPMYEEFPLLPMPATEDKFQMIMECETWEELCAVLRQLTEDDWLSFSEIQNEKINHKIETLIPAVEAVIIVIETPEPIAESEIIVVEESHVEVAPFVGKE